MSVAPSLSLQGHTDSITAVGKLADGLVVTASRDRTVKLWSLAEGRCVRSFTGYEDVITDISVLDDNKVLVLCRRTVQVLRVDDGRVLATDTYPNFLWSCAALHDGRAIVGDEHGIIYKIRWDARKLVFVDIVHAAHDGGVHCVYKHGDGFFATCSVDGTAKLWDAESLSLVHTFSGHTDEVCYVVFDDVYLLTSSIDSTVRVYNIRNGNHLCTLPNQERDLSFIHIVQDANLVIVNGDANELSLHQLPSGKCLSTCNVGMVLSAVVQLNASTLVIGGYNPYEVNVFVVNELIESVRGGASEIDELVAARLELSSGWEKYAKLLEKRLDSALVRIADLEDKLNRVTDNRIAKLETSLRRLSVSQDGDTDQCCVCLEPYSAGDEVFRLPCLHVHHAECLLPSLKKQKEPKCPICRSEVSGYDVANLSIWKWVPPASSSTPFASRAKENG